MVDIKTFKQLALAFSGVEEQPHFEKTSFRVKKKDLCYPGARQPHYMCKAVGN
jgi:hypothetical protein